MAQQTMYPAIPNSPVTELAAAIGAAATSINVVNGNALPAAPNLATIGSGETAETILYTGKSGNTLTGVTRGFNGTMAQAWAESVAVARYFTAYDHDAFRQNIADHETRLAGAESTLAAATNAATPNTVVKRDANGRFKAAAPSASDDVARKAEVDTKVGISNNETITGSKTFTQPIIAAGNFPIRMLGLDTDTPDKRHYQWDISADRIRLHALNDALAWVNNVMEFAHDASITILGNGNINLLWGSIAPEGNVTAINGSLYFQRSTTSAIWLKETGTGNTGWRRIALV